MNLVVQDWKKKKNLSLILKKLDKIIFFKIKNNFSINFFAINLMKNNFFFKIYLIK